MWEKAYAIENVRPADKMQLRHIFDFDPIDLCKHTAWQLAPCLELIEPIGSNVRSLAQSTLSPLQQLARRILH